MEISDDSHLRFTAKGFELFRIYLKNIVLTALTLGVYSFWGRVAIKKYLYTNTFLFEEPFNYHVTGYERLMGFLKGAGFIFLYSSLMSGFGYILTNWISEEILGMIFPLFNMILFLAITPLIMVGSERFRLSRTSYRNLRFKFDGSPRELYQIYFKGIVLSVLTFGIYLPWFSIQIVKFFRSHTCYGNERFQFDGNGKEMFLIYLRGVPLIFLTLGIYSFWVSAMVHRYYWNHTNFAGIRIRSEITGGMMLSTFLKSGLLVLVTVGIALPWAILMNFRILIETVSFTEKPNLENIQGELDPEASAFSDGLSEAGDVFDSISGFI